MVRAKFKWFGIQGRVQNLIMHQEERLFRNFHRQVFCWIDQWYGMTMNQIRELEEQIAKDLDKERHQGQRKGFVAHEN